VRVRTRLLSYFRAERGEKAAEMVREATDVSWSYIPTEFGALVREMRLIQRHRPRYNVRHKRKRTYAFVKITQEPAPRVLPVTRVAEDGSTYFGPFPNVGGVGETVRDLSYVLGLRDCASTTPVVFDDQLEMFGASLARAPLCMRADLGTCMAPCSAGVSAADYGTAVDQARRFLEGSGKAPLRKLAVRMAEAARAHEFEYAGVVRDRLDRLTAFQERLAAFRGRVRSLSFVYRVPGFKGADRLYLIHRGRLRAELPYPKSRTGRGHVARAIDEVFAPTERGPGELDAHSAAEILFIARWFESRPKELGRTMSPDDWMAERAPKRTGPSRPSASPSRIPPSEPAAPRAASC
jgi:excinuclease ABC subunit C